MSTVLILATYAGVMTNALSPGLISSALTFTSPTANVLFFALAQVLPLLALWRALLYPRLWVRRGLVVISVPFVLFAFSFGLIGTGCGAMMLQSGYENFFRRIHRIDTSRGAVSAYRTDMGATVSFGVMIRQECSVVSGLLFVRNLSRNNFAAAEVDMELVGPTEVKATYPPYEGDRTETIVRRYQLEPCPWPTS